MKDLTIYNVYVEMESQEQCDRMKKLCIENNLPIWNDEQAFKFWDKPSLSFFKYYDGYEGEECFLICSYVGLFPFRKFKGTFITEQEFINLLKQHNEN